MLFEVYWGTEDGTLLHATLEVAPMEAEVAEAMLYALKPIPEQGEFACAPPDYFTGYWDCEYLEPE